MTAVPNHNKRTLALLEAEDYLAVVVERWDAFSRRRHDLFGILDIVALGVGHTLGVQVTSRNNMSSRRTKILTSPALPFIRDAGWRIELWGWDKPAHRWRLKREEITL